MILPMNKNKKMNIVVFHLENGLPQSQSFPGTDIGPALKHCESLRQLARAGQPIAHVCLSTDVEDNVTLPGVSDTLPEDYSWVKRRPVFQPGRPSGVLAAVVPEPETGAPS